MNLLAHRRATRGLLLAAALLASTSAFAAPDAKKVADALVASLQAKGDAKATYESADTTGGSVTITNLKFVPRDGDTVTVPSVVIANPADRQPGGYTTDSITFDAGVAQGKNKKVTWTKGTADNAIIPAPSEMHSNNKLTPFSHFDMSGIVMTSDADPAPVTVSDLTVDLGNIVDGAPNSGTLKVTGVNIPGEVLKQDEQTKEWVDQLGYDKLAFDLMVDASYDASKDSLQLKSVSFDGADVGKLVITGTFGGLPRAKLQDPQKLRELAATATVDSATINFQNKGVVERVLDMQAKSMGATRAQFVDQITGALPLMLSMINNQGFQDKVATAATAFLKDPKSLLITASPSAPVPLMQVMGAARTAPQTVPDILAVDIKANQ